MGHYIYEENRGTSKGKSSARFKISQNVSITSYDVEIHGLIELR
jgi:hypothetical protein